MIEGALIRKWRPLLERCGLDLLRPASRSFLIADGEPMPLVGDVLLIGRRARFAGMPVIDYEADTPALRIENVSGRAVWYIPLPPEDVPPNAQPWVIDRRRGEARRAYR